MRNVAQAPCRVIMSASWQCLLACVLSHVPDGAQLKGGRKKERKEGRKEERESEASREGETVKEKDDMVGEGKG